MRHDILSADARRLASTMNRDLVKPIVDLNLGPRRCYPRLSLGLPDDSDSKQFVEIVAMLADRGLRIGQRGILDKLGLPEPGPGEPILEPIRGA